jgi:molybdate transport system substrate-binding protein
VRLLSTNGVRLALEKHLPPEVEVTFGTTADLKAGIEQGARFDVAILASAAIEELMQKGKLIADTCAEVGKSGAGVAIRKGARRPDLSSSEAFRRTLLSARSVAYVGTSATAGNLREIFKRLGIAREMKAKSKLLAGILTAEAVANGEAEIGLTQISEIVDVPGAELAGPFPPELQVYTVFTAAVSVAAGDPAAAREFVAHLASR